VGERVSAGRVRGDSNRFMAPTHVKILKVFALQKLAAPAASALKTPLPETA